MIRVLTVDDSRLSQQTIKQALGEEFELAAQAFDGVEAVELYVEHAPDVVIMDLVMPRRGGLEAMREIQALDPDARIIVLTTEDAEEMLRSAIQSGARDYILKPPPPERLRVALKRAVVGHKPRRPADLELGRFLVENATEVLQQFGSLPRSPAPPKRSSRRVREPVAFRIPVDGTLKGSINFYFDPALGREILVRTAPELVEDLSLREDALGEVANMVAGGVAGFLEARHGRIHFGPPQLFSEEKLWDRVAPHCRIHTAAGSLEIALVTTETEESEPGSD